MSVEVFLNEEYNKAVADHKGAMAGATVAVLLFASSVAAVLLGASGFAVVLMALIGYGMVVIVDDAVKQYSLKD